MLQKLKSSARFSLPLASVALLLLTCPPAYAAPSSKPTPVVAMCVGELDHGVDTSIRRKPDAIVLECEPYGGQYGNPNTEFLSKLSWISWGPKRAVGYGMFTYGAPQVCPPDGSGCTGGPQAMLIARVALSDPAPLKRGSQQLRFTTVTVTVSAVPDQPFGQQEFTFTPPVQAYE